MLIWWASDLFAGVVAIAGVALVAFSGGRFTMESPHQVVVIGGGGGAVTGGCWVWVSISATRLSLASY